MRRYASPGELANDIDSYLNGDIVSACPPSLMHVAILAQLYAQQYRWWDAFASYEEAFHGRRQLLGEQHPDTLKSRDNVANSFRILGLYEQAAVHYRDRLEVEQRSVDSLRIAEYQARLGSVLDRLGQSTEAEQLMRQAIDSFRRQQNTLKLQNALSDFGLALLRNQRFSEAHYPLAEAYNLSKQLGSRDDEQAQRQFTHAVACLMAPSSQTLEDPLPTMKESLASVLQQPIVLIASTVDDLQLLARCLQQKGEFDQAEQLLQRALNVLNRHSFHGARRSAILADLAGIAQHRGDHLKTKELLLRAVECLADTEKYPSKYNQTPEFDAMTKTLSNTLADRLVRVHRELGDCRGE